MASEAKRTGKTEVLSMRMDPKTRFMVEVLARLRGQSISTVVERAILEAADRSEIVQDRTWRDYWHVVEGVRALKIAAEQSLYPTYEEEYKLEFAKTHWPFFYYDSTRKSPRTAYIDVLWPKLEHFLDIWEKTHSSDYWAAGTAMRQALSDASVAPPDWPPKPPEKAPAQRPNRASRGGSDKSDTEIDDEIPF